MLYSNNYVVVLERSINDRKKIGRNVWTRKGGKTKATIKTRSRRAQLQFPVGRIHRHLRDGNYAQRISSEAPVYMAAVLEYLVTEVLDLAGYAAKDNRKKSWFNGNQQQPIDNAQRVVVDSREQGKVYRRENNISCLRLPPLTFTSNENKMKNDRHEMVET
ncbi:histone H2A-beta, sperm-like [Diachasmimorpha longicaudata]|uniref:histone H2A-beta, sperm-like n=1 Tax=Diachasmimorpha longicaudata TaxID=58733 RepID=UPI0030B87270